MESMSLFAAASRGTRFTAGDNPPAISTRKPTDIAAFFIRNVDYPQGQIFHAAQPEDIPTEPPAVMTRPKFPEKRQLSLRMLETCILFVQYPCRQKCRSLGICIHYQFVAGTRKCPDGLRCPACLQINFEQVWNPLYE